MARKYEFRPKIDPTEATQRKSGFQFDVWHNRGMPILLSDIKQLFRTVIIPFHVIVRDMTLPLPDHRPDNDAEHSWSLSMLAVALAPEIDQHLDVGLVAQYAIVHDVVEVYAGDTSVWAPAAQLMNKKTREAAALKQLKHDLPQFRHLFRYIEDYERRSTPEAQFVYALDKFLNLLTIIEDNGHYYRVKHKITKEMYDSQLAAHRTKAHAHPLVGAYYDELRELFDHDPAHFYQGGTKAQ